MPYSGEQIEAFRTNPELMAQRRTELFHQVEKMLTYSRREAFRRAEDVGRAALHVVEDPVVRERLTPDHPFGCKRPLFSNDYLQTFNRSNVELVVDPIERIAKDEVVTVDGRARTVDTVIFATGFETRDYASAIDLIGRNGVRIRDAWAEGAEAHFGVTTSGFPNFFMLYGPNTNGGNSIILMIEYQVEYLLRLIDAVSASGHDWIDVRRNVMDEFNSALQNELATVEVLQAGCNGYYRAPSGRIVTQWPHNFAEYRARVEAVDLSSSFETGCASEDC